MNDIEQMLDVKLLPWQQRWLDAPSPVSLASRPMFGNVVHMSEKKIRGAHSHLTIVDEMGVESVVEAHMPRDGRPAPSDAEWNDYARLANDVTGALNEALRGTGRRLVFSRRQSVARELWKMGYRPPALPFQQED